MLHIPRSSAPAPALPPITASTSPSTTRTGPLSADDQTEVVKWSSYYYQRRQRGGSAHEKSQPGHRHGGAHVAGESGDAHEPARKKTRRKIKKTGEALGDDNDEARRDAQAVRQVVDAFDLRTAVERAVVTEFIAHTRRRWSNPQRQWLDTEMLFRKLNGRRKNELNAVIRCAPEQEEEQLTPHDANCAEARTQTDAQTPRDLAAHAVPKDLPSTSTPTSTPAPESSAYTVEDIRTVAAALCARGVLTQCAHSHHGDEACHPPAPTRASAAADDVDADDSVATVARTTLRYRLTQLGMEAILSAAARSHSPSVLAGDSGGAVATTTTTTRATTRRTVAPRPCALSQRPPSRPSPVSSSSSSVSTSPRAHAVAARDDHRGEEEDSEEAKEAHEVRQGHPDEAAVTPVWTERQLQMVLCLFQENARKRRVKRGLSVMQLWSYLQLPQVKDSLLSEQHSTGTSSTEAEPAAEPVFHNRKELYLALNVLVERGHVRVVQPSPYPAEAKYGLVVVTHKKADDRL